MMGAIRKFVAGLFALSVLLGVYLLYARFNRMPPAAADVARTLPGSATDINDGDAPENVGTIADVGVGQVEQTTFYHRNQHNRVDRVLGFEQLLHKEGNQWGITHPYMKLFLPAFQCHVVADRGKVQVETAFSRPVANDALFSGNVVIHVIPTDSNDNWECFIHLDDVGFLAAKSLFSSSGPVRFLSRNVQLTGSGLEMVYDEPRNRLDLFRIFDLDSLRLKSRELGSVADLTPRHRSADAAQAPGISTSQTPASPGLGKPAGDRYQCIFRKNVAIETPDRVVVARDVLAIDDILWSGSGRTRAATDQPPGPNKPDSITYPAPDALNTTVSSHSAISSIPEGSFDVVVTCEGGFEVTPKDRGQKAEDRGPEREGPGPPAAGSMPSSTIRPPSSDLPDRQQATAQRIDYNALTTDTTLAGPVEMVFQLDPNGLTGEKAGAKPMPMTVTAKEAVRFLAASKQVLFEGGCTVLLWKSEPNATDQYVLLTPRLILDLATDANKTGEAAVTIRKLATDGGPATLRIVRRGPEKLLGWTKLDASQFQYDADLREFIAVGPGTLWIHNAEAMEKTDPNGFGLSRPCYARLSNFDTLKFSASANQIVVEDDAQQLLLDYFPLAGDKYQQHVQTVAGHVEATLKQIAQGRLEIVSLTASQGIEFEDETNHFVGSSLFYDHSQTLVTIHGDDVLPCYLNGALVDEIEMNLKTGQIKTEIPTPSVFQVRR